jgi:hypothetical protein
MPQTIFPPAARAQRGLRRPASAPSSAATQAAPARPARDAQAEHRQAAGDQLMIDTQPVALSVKLLAQVALATVLVSGVPTALAWYLRASGVVSSLALCVVLGMAASLCASYVGCLVWEKRPGSEDLLFSELMVWGFIHRLRTQRRLGSAIDMVGPMSAARRRSLDGLSVEEQAKQLAQLVSGMETRDPYLHGHSRRVARYSWMIAARMGLPREQLARIRTAAAIHDVGKVQTPKAILHKPGRLTDAEFDVIKRHPGVGARMAAALHDPRLTAMVRHHHERLDGTGYPEGLRGEDIPLGARIIAVADTFDAITSSRPYRPASAHKKAIDILKEEAGTRLDPAVVRAFCGHYAGRRPVAAWAFVAGLPERLISWLGASVAGAASAAKVAAIAALLGGAAATSTLVLPAVGRHVSRRHVPSSALVRPHAGQTAWRPAALPNGAVTKRARRVPATPVRGRPRSGSPRRHPAIFPAGSAGPPAPAQSSGAPVQGASQVVEGNGGKATPNEHHGKTEEAPGRPRAEEPTVKGKEVLPKGKPVEPPVKGKIEELPGKAKEEIKPKVEEVKAKREEVKPKGEEVKGKVEAVKAKVEEVKSKVEKVVGIGLPVLK